MSFHLHAKLLHAELVAMTNPILSFALAILCNHGIVDWAQSLCACRLLFKRDFQGNIKLNYDLGKMDMKSQS